MEFERHKNRFKDDHGLLSSENEDLQTRIDELKNDVVRMKNFSGIPVEIRQILLDSSSKIARIQFNSLTSHLQKLNEEALAHATMQYNIQLSQLKTENAVLISNVEKEKNSKEKAESEVGKTNVVF